MRRICFALLIGLLTVVGGTISVSAAPAQASMTTCSAALFQGDRRLGPRDLPDAGEVGTVLAGYQRTGVLTEAAFFHRYWDAAARGGQGGWDYPPLDGYEIGPNYRPIVSERVLRPGALLDRFGAETGGFLSPEGTAYTRRAIPPSNLVAADMPAGCNYHEYQVTSAFKVDSGPIAAWFGQPGGGVQFQLVSAFVPGAPNPLSVGWMVEHHFLTRVP
jgi:hypothetical protein